MIKLLINSGVAIKDAKIGILGVTFKENVTDVRNSRVPDIYSELKQFGITPLVHDPKAGKEDILHEYGIQLSEYDDLKNLDALILAVGHAEYRKIETAELCSKLKRPSVLMDVKSLLNREDIPKGVTYWSL